MKNIVLAIIPLAYCSAFADWCPTSVAWSGCVVFSNEDLYEGSIHTSYPLYFLFDGRPDTAWVYSGLPLSKRPNTGDWEMSDPPSRILRPSFWCYFDKPIEISSVRIMPGYNKSSAVFSRNNRVTNLEVKNLSSA